MTRTLAFVLIPAMLSVFFFAATPVAAQPFGAGECTIGPGLAATLLFPYFEVDLVDPLGVGTLIAVNNGLIVPTMARVVLWTDWGVPTLAFDLYLPPFAVETINIIDLLNGIIPSTGVGADLTGFDFCDALPPFHLNPALSVNESAQLIADHTGQSGPLAFDCAGSPHPDQIARGYITVDVVDECSGVEGFLPNFTPVNSGFPYFAEGGGGDGIAIASNRLWGDIIYVDFSDNSAQGSEAIPIWANPDKFTDTDIFTFYGRFSGWDGRDERVPLPSIWDQRFLNGGPFAGGADLIVWRDTGAPLETAACGAQPSPFPLEDTTTVFDPQGDFVFLGSNDNFPLSTQRTSVDSLAVPLNFGWLQLELAQSWVQPSLNASDLFSANFNGTPIQFLCTEDPTPTVTGTDDKMARPNSSINSVPFIRDLRDPSARPIPKKSKSRSSS